MNFFPLAVSATSLVLFTTTLLLALHIGYSKDDLLHPLIITSVIFSFFLVIPGMYLLVTQQFRLTTTTPQTTLSQALFLSSLSFTVICVSFIKAPDIRIRSRFNRLISEVPPQHYILSGFFLLLLGLLPYYYYVTVNGGFVRMLLIDARLQFQVVPNTARYRVLSWGLVFGGYALMLGGSAVGELPRNQVVRRLIYIASLVVFAYTISFRERLLIGFVLGCLVIYFHENVYKIRGLTFISTGIVGFFLILAVPLFEYLTGNFSSLPVSEVIYTYRFEAFLILLQQVPESTSFYWGETFSTAVWFNYPGKSKPVGDILEKIVVGTDRENFAVSGTVLAEIYLNFGTAGLFIFSTVFGVIIKQVYKIKNTTGLTAGSYPVLLYILLVILPTAITWGTRVFVFTIGPVFITTVAALIIINKL
ncbi:oligosaccharide repeat unit polymerase [Halorubrum xinjiangense]|uniref:oligosaccharide repeat unit polymerase n=1 Tax=Halorubrum xinjiangense TaxID=261291 RepID=UPI003C6EE94A